MRLSAELSRAALLALEYIARGWRPIPVPLREKNPGLSGWEQLRIDADSVERHFGRDETNIGVLLGDCSGGLVDVDLDCPEAVFLAPTFLPQTDATFGRASKPRSHWLYRVTGLQGRQFVAPKADGATLVEIRAATSKGTPQQTIFPGSLHTSGELISWFCEPGEPAPVDEDVLRRSVAALAAAALLARHFPAPGSRHRATLALVGSLVRGRMAADDVDHFVTAVRHCAGADPDKNIISMLRDSERRYAQDDSLFGFTALSDFFGERIASQALLWLGLSQVSQRRSSNLPTGYTEDEIALAFEARHSGQLLFNVDSQRWHAWTGTHWPPNNKRLALHWARELCREIAVRHEGEHKPPNIRRVAVADAVERFARAAPVFAVSSDTFDSDAWLLGTPGGTVDLRTGLLSPSMRTDRITRLAAVAPAASPDCALWRRFLDEATRGDAELQGFLQRMVGYCLTGITTEHALFYGHGGGGNGKTVFQNTVRRIFGDYARTSAMDTFTASKNTSHPTDIAMLQGARLVLASETDAGRSWDEARIKVLTGGDPVSARFMRQDFFEFTPQFKLFIIGNHAPMLRNVDEATRRRFNILPFVHRPPNPDRGLELALTDEGPGILRWAVEGCLAWQQGGLGRPAAVVAATDDYFEQQDMLGQWLDELCDREEKGWETFGKLFSSWSGFARNLGEEPGTWKWFSDALVKRGFRKDKLSGGKRERIFRGLSVRFDPIASGIEHD